MENNENKQLIISLILKDICQQTELLTAFVLQKLIHGTYELGQTTDMQEDTMRQRSDSV